MSNENEYSERPWGNYQVLDASQPDHKIKRIVVYPGRRLSYQKHSHRGEHWFIVRGNATVTIDGSKIDVVSGDAVDIVRGAAHRIENTGSDDLVFIEVQHGDSFEESDIVRLEDDFGRADKDSDIS